MRKKKYLWYHLYHCDHDDRLIPASYVVPQINEYLILRLLGFFAPKSLLMCIPNVCIMYYVFIYLCVYSTYIHDSFMLCV